MTDMIRLELLKLAKDILMEENMNTRIKMENDWHRHGPSPTVEFPVIPSVKGKDIVKLASLLNKFVSENDDKSSQD